MNYNPRTPEAYNLFHRGILSFSRAEQQGMCVDVNYIEKKKHQLTRKIAHLEEEFKDTPFFKEWEKKVGGEININSGTQLKYFLYTIKKYKPKKFTPSGAGSTDAEALAQLHIPELEILAQRDKLKRLRDVNLDGFLREQVDGVLHPFFNLHLVKSYRSSCNSPNLQNVPVRDEESMQTCRRAIYPRKGHQLLEADFKAIEVAINSCYNKDTNLIKYVSDPDSDMHADMAKQIFKIDDFDSNIPEHDTLRKAAKNGFVFPQFYGDYYKNCTENLLCNWGKLSRGRFKEGQGLPMPEGNLSDHLMQVGLLSYSAFEKHLEKIEDDFWRNRFPDYAEWKERWYNIYKKHGYFDLLTGFRCSGVMGKKEVTNYPAQGTAFHCLLWSFNRIDEIMREEKWDSKLVSQVHDSAILDVHPDELEHVAKTIKRVTTVELPEFWKWIVVPLSIEFEKCEINEPWSEKKKFVI